MAKEFTRGFYSTKAWQKCRNEYYTKAKGLCEICLANGIYKGGAIVHHKIPLTPDIMDKPELLLNHDNLQLVCRECHERIHDVHKRKRRYDIDESGRVLMPPGQKIFY